MYGGRRFARGRVRGAKKGQNKGEAAFDRHLDAEMALGRIIWKKFEAITIKLGPDTRLTVDFVIQQPDGEVWLVDVKPWMKKKGKVWMEEDARLKLRLATEFPFRVFTVAWTGAEWKYQEICPDSPPASDDTPAS